MYETKITIITILDVVYSSWLSLYLKVNKLLQFCHMFKTQYHKSTIETIMWICIKNVMATLN